MDVARGQRDGDRVDSAVDGGLDVSHVGAVPTEDRSLQAEVRDLFDDLALVAAHDRDAGFDLIDADLIEHASDSDLLDVREHDAGGLFTVAERRVVKPDFVLAEIALDREFPYLGRIHVREPPDRRGSTDQDRAVRREFAFGCHENGLTTRE